MRWRRHRVAGSIPALACFVLALCACGTLRGQGQERTPLQPGPPVPAPAPPPVTAAPAPQTNSQLLSSLLGDYSWSGRGGRRTSRRLARTPAMFGDFYSGITGEFDSGNYFITADFPLAGGSRRTKVSEHNRALPTDRVYFLYNHFQNAARLDRAAGPNSQILRTEDANIDRYTLGLEKTFQSGLWSLEARLPVAGRIETSSSDFSMDGGNWGNLAVIFKRLLFEHEQAAVSAGLGIDIPTGSDVRAIAPLVQTQFRAHNEAVHLMPYVGFLAHPGEAFFWQGFAQLDIAANSDIIEVENGGPMADRLRLNDPTLLYLDLSTGYWLYRDPSACYLTGLAGVLEFHYTTTLQDTDRVAISGGVPSFGTRWNRFDIVNLTIGLHAELGQTKLRVGGVLPLSEDVRFFDSEITAAVIRHF